jgi:hypothetical protein
MAPATTPLAAASIVGGGAPVARPG